ncbi:hypothetical protein [Nocardioides sp. AE5]|uniref:hypothetical protein n=1 Tax=Nocardioides sp. AE5 TaxID=2962573 RepID=UPI002881EC6E|nr:hypothetical protein [Nocardioides sp. AE5]MDT0201722.1 hypothetical protein [Nocardioides sp. AE5]
MKLTIMTGAVAAVLPLSGCASSGPSTSELLESGNTDQSAETFQDRAPGASTDYLDELFSESLHDGVAPAAPGTAYIEVAGERFEFGSVQCDISDQTSRGIFSLSASDDASGTGHQFYLSREIGPDIGFNWENEYIQLALLTTPARGDTPERFSNSMAQHGRDEGDPPAWDWGNGTSPLVRVVGDEATAMGTLEGILLAPDPLEGDFVAAATCP